MADKDKLNLVAIFLEHHRYYISRNWQYFGAILLVNSIVLSAYKDIKSEPLLIIGISVSSLILVAIFYHLINWTNSRIDRNVDRINSIDPAIFLQHPPQYFEGIIIWLKLGVICITIPHIFLLWRYSNISGALSLLGFFIFVFFSEKIIHMSKKLEREFIEQQGLETK